MIHKPRTALGRKGTYLPLFLIYNISNLLSIHNFQTTIMAPSYNYEYFNVTFPGEYVAQVEINRPEKMNAFNETYVRTRS